MNDGKIERLVFKHEDEERGMPIGPVWKKIGGQSVNYADSDQKAFDGKMFPKWYTLRQARRIAKELHVPLEEV